MSLVSPAILPKCFASVFFQELFRDEVVAEGESRKDHRGPEEVFAGHEVFDGGFGGVHPLKIT